MVYAPEPGDERMSLEQALPPPRARGAPGSTGQTLPASCAQSVRACVCGCGEGGPFLPPFP